MSTTIIRAIADPAAPETGITISLVGAEIQISACAFGEGGIETTGSPVTIPTRCVSEVALAMEHARHWAHGQGIDVERIKIHGA
jgi:hypothetical protein